MISKTTIKKGIKEIKNRGVKSFFQKAIDYFFSPTRGMLEREIKEWEKNRNKPKPKRKESRDLIKGMVSVIIPIYNRTWELEKSIESILGQTYQNLELILVTDGSPKETMEVVEKYRSNPKVKIFHFYNNTGNAVRGRNKGIKETKGEFIAFLDSDDFSESDRLEKSLKYMKESDADIIYGWQRVVTDGTRKDVDFKNGEILLANDNFTFDQLCCGNQLCQSTTMVRASAIKEVGGLKKELEYREDHELWLRLFYFGYKFKMIPEVLVNIRVSSGNNTLNFKAEDQKWYEMTLKEYKEKGNLSPKIAYIIPGTAISGGIAVVLQHANRLLKLGYDVSIFTQDLKEKIDWFPEQKVTLIPINTSSEYLKDNIDILIATSWSTAPAMENMEAGRKIYFVQSDERRFYEDDETKRIIGETYKIDCEYMTEALWIQKWLKEEYGHDSYYVPNGVDEKLFHKTDLIEPKSNKPRILIEGRVDLPYKGVKDSYEAVKDLECGIWLVSNGGDVPKDWKVSRIFENVPMEKMKEIYSSCDILVKMSKVEGFYGPPLEAMACGCAVVTGKVTGYDEYIQNENNALVVEQGDITGAKEAVEKLIKDAELKNKLIENGYKTAKEWSWDKSIDKLEEVINK